MADGRIPFADKHRKDNFFMTKAKIAVTLALLAATGAFGGFTYKSDVLKLSKGEDQSQTSEETTENEEAYEEPAVTTTAPAVTTAPAATTTAPAATTKPAATTTKKTTEKKKDEPKATTTTTAAVTTAPEIIIEVPEEIIEEIPAEYEEVEVIEAPVAVEAPVLNEEPEPITDYSEYITYYFEEETVEETAVEEDSQAEVQEEAPAAEAEETSGEETSANSGWAIDITQNEYYMLCNVVAHEYGSDWVSDYDKALVVEVVMNRVKSSLYPDTIYGVLTQPYQFSGAWSYVNLGTYSYQVTESCKRAVDLYLSDPSQFNHGYTSFYGDGYRNYFR